jgi:hypothetical protein
LNFTPEHQSVCTDPQNGRIGLGPAVLFFEDSRFDEAFERDDTTDNDWKSHISRASSKLHFNALPSDNNLNTPSPNSTHDDIKPLSTDALIVQLKLDIIFKILYFFVFYIKHTKENTFQFFC